MTPLPAVAILIGANRIRSEAMTIDIRVSQHEISSCADAAQIVGVGGFRDGPLLVLKFAYDTDDTHILCLNDSATRHLFAVLKALAREHSATEELFLWVDVNTGAASAWSPSDASR
jgi:hypothetical protein